LHSIKNKTIFKFLGIEWLYLLSQLIYQMKKILYFVLITLSFGTSSQKNTPKIHLIYLSDITDVSFGAYTKADNKRIGEVARSVAGFLKYNLDYISIEEKNFTSKGVFQALKKITVKSTDIIILYYSGLGIHNPKSDYPLLKLKDYKKNKLNLDQLADTLISKKPSQCIVIADTRNKLFGKTARGEGTPDLTRIKKDISKKVVENLFSKQNKLIKIVSATANQKSIVFTDMLEKGSIFSICLRNVFVNLVNDTTEKELKLVNFKAWLNKTQQLMNSEFAKETNIQITQTIVHNLK
jgi:Caspase domain